MLHIAGGIILAVIILSFWPVIAGAGVLLLLAALAIGGAFLVFGTESGRDIALVVGGFVVGMWLLGKVGAFLGNLAGTLRSKIKNAGGWDILISNWIFELRPAITERQKIQKIAKREKWLKTNLELKLLREKRAREKIEKRKRDAEAMLERARANALATVKKRLIRRIQRLEKKFARIGQLRFDYSDAIEIYSQGAEGYPSEKIVHLKCCLPQPTGSELDNYSHCYYEIQTAPRFGYEKVETFNFLDSLIKSVRNILRRAAAENISRAAKRTSYA